MKLERVSFPEHRPADDGISNELGVMSARREGMDRKEKQPHWVIKNKYCFSFSLFFKGHYFGACDLTQLAVIPVNLHFKVQGVLSNHSNGGAV